MDEERTTAASTRTSVMRWRGLAFAGLVLMAAAATVAAGSSPASSTASDSPSPTPTSTLALKITGPSEVPQGRPIKYTVQLTPADGAPKYSNVKITLSAKADWTPTDLKVTCPDGTESSGSCSINEVAQTVDFTATVATTSAKIGQKVTVTASGKDNSGSIGPSQSDPTTITPRPSHTSTPPPTKSSSPTPTASTSSAPPGKHPGSNGGSGGGTGPGSGGGTSPGTGGGTRHGSGGGTGPGSGGGTSPGSHHSTSGDGQPHPTFGPGGALSGMPPSLGGGSSLSATSLPSMPASVAPTPLVATPPTTGPSGSPSDQIQLTGESSGTVQPVTRSVPLAAVGLVLFVVSGWKLARRRLIRKVGK